MRRLLCFLVATAVGMVATWAQRSDVNGDGIINSADVVCVYNDIINGVSSEVENEVFTVNGVTFMMIGVAYGNFLMGATSEQGDDAKVNEKPAHSVSISSFHIGQTEVSQALWQAVMGNNPSIYKGDDLPVENVSWYDCQNFIEKLNDLTGKQFRLPTEAEWEYACRGGNKSKGYKYSGSDNIDEVAWYDGNSDDKTHPVTTKRPNELGIYNMCGNVAEWCQDWYGDYISNAQTNPTGPKSGTLRVARGGTFTLEAMYCRSSSRLSPSPGDENHNIGFRLALTI